MRQNKSPATFLTKKDGGTWLSFEFLNFMDGADLYLFL